MRIIPIIFLWNFVWGSGLKLADDICPEIVSRIWWGARTPKEIQYSIIPIEYVIIHHTVTPNCITESECIDLLKGMQNFHMEKLNFPDIGYNFIVGGDGRIYEGVGWHKIGAHTKNYNSKSIGIAITGTFTDKLPNESQLEATKKLLRCGTELNELDLHYKLFGASQVSLTASPGLKLYQELTKWGHFTNAPPKYE